MTYLWGYPGFQVTGMIEGFFGFEILIPGFFWVEEFGLCVYVARVRMGFFWVFKTISCFLVVLTVEFVLYHVFLSGIFFKA